MPPDVEPFGLPPRDAIRYFRRRRARPLPSWSWLELQRAEHAKMFTVAKSAGFDIVGDVADAVDRAQAQGQTFAQFQADLEPLLRKKGWWGKQTVVGPDGRPRVVNLGSPRRLKTIFRTNLRVSAAAARWERIQDHKGRFPYLMYDAVNDSRTRPQHLEWDGLVLPVDHPFWKTHGPPNGWGCRCILRQLSEAVMRRRGLEVSEAPEIQTREWTNHLSGEIRSVPVGIDPGWDYNPGEAHVRRAQRGLIAKLESRQLEIGRAVVRHNLGTPDFRRFVRGEATARGGEERAVALIGSDRSRTLGFQDRVRAVRLSSESVARHQPRYAGFGTENWQRVQQLLDQGEWISRGRTHRLLWLDEGGNPWVAVAKLTRNGEVYLQSYRRAGRREVANLKRARLR